MNETTEKPIRKTLLIICPKCRQKALFILAWSQPGEATRELPDEELPRLMVFMEGRTLPLCAQCQVRNEVMGIARYPPGDEAAMKQAVATIEQDWTARHAKQEGEKLHEENQGEKTTS
jgi:hypothetical protein